MKKNDSSLANEKKKQQQNDMKNVSELFLIGITFELLLWLLFFTVTTQ